MESFLTRNQLVELMLSDNNLRSANAEKICKAICLQTSLRVCDLKNNFLG